MPARSLFLTILQRVFARGDEAIRLAERRARVRKALRDMVRKLEAPPPGVGLPKSTVRTARPLRLVRLEKPLRQTCPVKSFPRRVATPTLAGPVPGVELGRALDKGAA